MRALVFVFFSFAIAMCSVPEERSEDGGAVQSENQKQGDLVLDTDGNTHLFIIGGGKRTKLLMNSLKDAASLNEESTVGIISLDSIETDTSFFYAAKSFENVGINNCIHITNAQTLNSASWDCIYLSGGDQNRLMNLSDSLGMTSVIDSLRREGVCIAGTSAGAAVMSEVMITGDQKRILEYESTYSILETENGIYGKGFGWVSNVIVDQHFIQRSRYNRAITALSEFPGKSVLGIDESTAAEVKNNQVIVHGESQVILFTASDNFENRRNKLKHPEVIMGIYAAGDTIK
ncbi:MAG: cyanophycinase [Flavobacteriales bacterium]|nr:cyanophycinase [Flavobacteriales bacterium]